MKQPDIITSVEFKEKFKEVSFSNNYILKNGIVELLDNTEHSYYRMNFIYKYSINSDGDKFYDRDVIIAIMNDYLANGYSYIYDYTLPNGGGFKYLKFDRKKYFKNERDLNYYDEKIIAQGVESFNKIFSAIEKDYVSSNDYLSSILETSIFIDREPKGIREAMLASKGNKLFDVKKVLLIYDKLMELFWSDYVYNKQLSSTKAKIKRFTKELNKDYSISLLIDYKFLEGELKYNYFECPKINIELYNNNLNEYVDQRAIYIQQSEFPIIYINPYLFFGHGLAGRIGSGISNEDELIKKLFIYFDAYSQLMKAHLKYVEKNILDTISQLIVLS